MSLGLRIGVVGCGAIGRTHLSALLELDDDMVIHVCDHDVGAAARLASDFGLPPASVFSDVDSMLSAVDLDVIHVTTPPDSHYSVAVKALTAGAHVIVEKPMAMTTVETLALYDMADRCGRLLAVDHSVLLMPCVQQMTEVVRGGGLGEPISFDCYFGHAEKQGAIPYRDPFHWAYRMPGGVLLNLITHPASLMCEVLGEPVEIRSTTLSRNVLPHDVGDLLHVSATFGASLGSFTISMGHGNADRVAVLRLEGGTVTTDLSRQVTTVRAHRGPSNIIDKMVGGYGIGVAHTVGMTQMLSQVATKKLRRDPGLRNFVHQFYDAVLRDAPIPVDRANAISCARITDVALGEVAS
jgi:predicted dehydrogenase